MEREFLEGLRVAGEALPRETVDDIMARHEASVRQVQQDAAVQIAVHNAGGRNLTAIKALLDVSSMEDQEDYSAAAEAAVEAVKKEHGYLFAVAVPPYHGGGGSPIEPVKQLSLAEALRLRRKRS